MLSRWRGTGGSGAVPGHSGVAGGWTWQGDRAVSGWAKPGLRLQVSTEGATQSRS